MYNFKEYFDEIVRGNIAVPSEIEKFQRRM